MLECLGRTWESEYSLHVRLFSEFCGEYDQEKATFDWLIDRSTPHCILLQHDNNYDNDIRTKSTSNLRRQGPVEGRKVHGWHGVHPMHLRRILSRWLNLLLRRRWFGSSREWHQSPSIRLSRHWSMSVRWRYSRRGPCSISVALKRPRIYLTTMHRAMYRWSVTAAILSIWQSWEKTNPNKTCENRE